jgi:hypothetical protein
MAKKRLRRKRSGRRVKVVVTPRDLARALEDIGIWIADVRRTILKLDKKCTVTVTVPEENQGGATIPTTDGCPPPD